MTDTIRSFCPLDCGWHYDRPEPDPTELACARPDLTSFEIAQILITGQLQQDEEVIRGHLETHELLEWVQAVARLRQAEAERDRLSVLLEKIRDLAATDTCCDLRHEILDAGLDQPAKAEEEPR